jgi:hypothetical protein
LVRGHRTLSTELASACFVTERSAVMGSEMIYSLDSIDFALLVLVPFTFGVLCGCLVTSAIGGYISYRRSRRRALARSYTIAPMIQQIQAPALEPRQQQPEAASRVDEELAWNC